MSKYEIKTLVNHDDKTALEKKHVPHIIAPDKVKKGELFEVTVQMGNEIDHPMEEGISFSMLNFMLNISSLPE